MWMRLTYYYKDYTSGIETEERIAVNLGTVKRVSSVKAQGSKAKSKLTFIDSEVIEVTETQEFIIGAIKGELVGRSDEASGVIRG